MKGRPTIRMLAQAGLKSRLYDMNQLFQRKPIEDLVIDESDPRSLKRVLGVVLNWQHRLKQ